MNCPKCKKKANPSKAIYVRWKMYYCTTEGCPKTRGMLISNEEIDLKKYKKRR